MLKKFKLSHPQRRIIFTELLNPGTGFANIAWQVKLGETVEKEKLQKAINFLIESQESLRLVLNVEEEKETGSLDNFFQKVLSSKEAQLKELPHCFLQTKEELEKWLKETSKTPFQLLGGLLFQFTLLTCEKQNYLYIKTHHLISDNFSARLLVDEIKKIYLQLLENKDVALKSYSYLRDYLKREEDYKKSSKFIENEKYWLEIFRDLPEEAKITYNSKKNDFKAKTTQFSLPLELKIALQDRAKESKVTLFEFYLAAVYLYLVKITNKEDLVLGLPFHGRYGSSARRTLGMYVATLPIRINVSKDKTLTFLISQIHQKVKEAIENHAEYPFDLLMKKLYEKHGNFGELLSVNVVQAGIKENTGDRYCDNGADPSPLTFVLNAGVKETLTLAIIYQETAFCKEEIELLKGRLESILRTLSGKTDLLIKDLEIISKKEREILKSFNKTFAGYPQNKTVVDLFEEAVKNNPKQLAVICKNEKLTYQELNEKANSLAYYLKQKNVQKDELVGVLVSRSKEFIIATLAILKAGGAYLPIDPAYPLERIQYMLEDSKAKILLSQESLKEKSTDFQGEWLDLADESLYFYKNSNLRRAFNAQNLAYVIYTSGSTGKPKGVMIEHQALAHICFWIHDYHQITEEDRIAQYSGFGFDASVWEIFPFLTKGATVHIIADDIRLSSELVSEYFKEHAITVTDLPTQFCEQLMETIAEKELPDLRLIVTGGDKLRTFYDGKYKLVNEYGPTEYTISATRFLVERYYENIPIGRPLSNTQCYIVDQDLKELPVGVAGELCIAGRQMARGYLNRDDLTQEKFVDNPFSKGEKLYRTGDLARYLPDGNIEFLGRIDFQVKIRGFRIELGEIEQQLLLHPLVKDTVVLALDDKRGMKYLCAYVVSERMEEKELKTFLGQELPEYMLPSYFIFMEKLPVTPNGKVDKRALPEPDLTVNGAEYLAPSNELEEQLVNIWQEILDLERIGIKDNFFNLGGHSLKAGSMQAKIQKILNVKVSLADIFASPTVESLAYCIRNLVSCDLPMLKVAPLKEAYPLSSAQMSMLVLGREESVGTSYNISLVNIIEGEIDAMLLESCIRRLIMRHESLRTSFEEREDGAVQKVAQKVSFVLEYWEKEDKKEEEQFVHQLTKEFIQRFDFEKAPLLRAGLVKIAPLKFVFILDVHHIVFDGTSASLFMEELARLYQGEKLKKQIYQYKDYVLWEKTFKNSEAYKKQEAYWLNVYKGDLPVLNLATDFARPSKQSFEGYKHYFTIERKVFEELQKLAQDNGATLYHILLAAWYVLLYRYTGQEDIAVGSPVAGRPHPDLANVMGMFVNTIAIRMFVDGKMSFVEFLKEVKNTAILAVDNQDYEFIELVSKLKIARDLSRNPIFDVMFVLQNAGEIGFNTQTMKMKPWKLQNNVAQVDLTLEVEEIEGELEAVFEYAVKLFKHNTIERMAEHFQNILKAITVGAEVKLDEIILLSDDERKYLLETCNNTYLPVAKDKTWPMLFREQVALYPQKKALVFKNENYTYAELDQKTDALAFLLQEEGVQKETIVAVMVKRSAEIMIAAIAIMKAGGVYLPIDADYPKERICYMLDDSNALLLLTESSLMDKADSFSGQILDLKEETLFKQEEIKRFSLKGKAEDLAYIIYTSGSTGKPKGVMIEQRSLVNLCFWQQHFHSVTFKDNAAQYSGFGFDASVWEMFPFLACGATLHIIAEELRLSPEDLNQYFVENNITITNFPTQFCEQFMEMIDNTTLKTLVTGGDKLRTFKKQNYRLVNEYGPTEYTVSATAFLVECFYDNIPIGKPLGNTWLYILDKTGNLQPLGGGAWRTLYCWSTNGTWLFKQRGFDQRKICFKPFCNLQGKSNSL